MTKQKPQADSSIHEDQLLTFLVNALTGAFGVSIAGNGNITPEDIYEVLVGATADGTSISTLCNRSEDSYSGNDILYHLRTKFDLDTVSAVGNTLLQEYTLELLPEQVEIVVDFHLRPYYGDEDETDGLYYSEAKRFGIEATYRLSEASLIATTTQDATRRLLFVVISLFMQNVWRYLHWEYAATPRRGGRCLWWWPFEEFIRMVIRAAWNALSVRREVPANKPPDDRFTR